MLYKRLGSSGLDVSILGFGAMRLPLQNASGSPAAAYNPNAPIDEEEATRMIEYAIEKGVNYFDSAYMYHGGKSELVLGRALKPHRDRVMISTKLPAVLVNGPEDFDRFLNEQLKKLDTGFVDVYLLHGLSRESWSKLRDFGVLQFLDRAVGDGRVRCAGFSFHDDAKVFKEIVDAYGWKLCQIQYNYYDEHAQAGKDGLFYAASKGLGVVIMEPIRGGMLAEPVPDQVQAIWDTAPVKRTPAEWALRWVWNHDEVSTVLSGMSTMAQVVENIRIADDGWPKSLSASELSLIDRVRQTYGTMVKVGCTGCGYCMPCPSGVNIPMMFSAYNNLFVFPHKAEMTVTLYNMFLKPEQRASACMECGQCEETCPQHLEIRDQLKRVHEALFRPDRQPEH
jgi:predicted aldo/keto reductase-like oxidoreductase